MATSGALIASNNVAATNATTTAATYVTLTSTFLQGTYVLLMNCGVSSGTTATRYSDVSVAVDGTDVMSSITQHNVANFTTYTSVAEVVSLTAGPHTIVLQFNRAAVSAAATITARDGTLVMYQIL